MSKIKDILDSYFGSTGMTRDKIKRTALLAVLAALALIAFAVNSGDDEDTTRDELPQIDETVVADIYVDIGPSGLQMRKATQTYPALPQMYPVLRQAYPEELQMAKSI